MGENNTLTLKGCGVKSCVSFIVFLFDLETAISELVLKASSYCVCTTPAFSQAGIDLNPYQIL